MKKLFKKSGKLKLLSLVLFLTCVSNEVLSVGLTKGSMLLAHCSESAKRFLFDQLSDNFGYGVGFNVAIPIFNRFQTKNRVAQSVINKEIFETRLESEKVSLKQTIEQSFLDVRTALKSYEAAKISLEAQEEAFKNAQERYNFGAMTQFDFDQVRTRLVNAQATLIRSKYDYVFKTKVLQFYAGDLVLE